MYTYLGFEVQGRLVRSQGLRSRLLDRCRRRRITSGNSGYFASLVDGRRSVNVEARSRTVERVRDVSSRARVFLYEQLHGGFQGFHKQGSREWEQTVGNEGRCGPEVGLHARASEKLCVARYVCACATNGRMRKLVYGGEVGLPRWGVGWLFAHSVWNYATDVGTCGAWIQCARAGRTCAMNGAGAVGEHASAG